jgi:hypothetical protein
MKHSFEDLAADMREHVEALRKAMPIFSLQADIAALEIAITACSFAYNEDPDGDGYEPHIAVFEGLHRCTAMLDRMRADLETMRIDAKAEFGLGARRRDPGVRP